MFPELLFRVDGGGSSNLVSTWYQNYAKFFSTFTRNSIIVKHSISWYMHDLVCFTMILLLVNMSLRVGNDAVPTRSDMYVDILCVRDIPFCFFNTDLVIILFLFCIFCFFLLLVFFCIYKCCISQWKRSLNSHRASNACSLHGWVFLLWKESSRSSVSEARFRVIS